VNLTKANLTNAVLRGAKLVNADLSEATCVGADLTGADMTGRTRRARSSSFLDRRDGRGEALRESLESAIIDVRCLSTCMMCTCDIGLTQCLDDADYGRKSLEKLARKI